MPESKVTSSYVFLYSSKSRSDDLKTGAKLTIMYDGEKYKIITYETLIGFDKISLKIKN